MHIPEGYSRHWICRRGKNLITWFSAPVCFKGCVDSLLSKGNENWVTYSTVLGNEWKENHTRLLSTLSKYNRSTIITVTYNELVLVMYWNSGVEYLFILYILRTEFLASWLLCQEFIIARIFNLSVQEYYSHSDMHNAGI